jgi:GTP-binding protein
MDAKAEARTELESERRAARAAGITPDGDSTGLTDEDDAR